MNTTSRSPIVTNTRGHPSEFQQIITEKSENFVGREFVFAAINEFLHKYAHGYFTLRGAPGSGKTAILAKYVTSNPQVIYYSAQVEGKNRADQFLLDICTQLINYYPDVGKEYIVSLPDNATEGSWFLSLLLQKISDSLDPDQRLIIAIDALDAIAPNSQPPGSNLFYLPRYLPERVYFLLTRRPFLREKSGLLIETPSQTLDLGDYPEQNREDVQAYIRNYLTPLDPPQPPLKKGGLRSEESNSYSSSSSSISPPFLRGAGGDREGLGERSNLKSWLTTHKISEQEFSDRLTTQSDNNFMYLSQILPAIAQNFYSEPFQIDRLPPSLETYYQSHWQRMAQSADLTAPNPQSDSPLLVGQGLGERSTAVAVLNILVQQEQPRSTEAVSEAMSAGLIAEMIDGDEYEVEEVLENWIEFLQQQRIGGEIRYSLYHSSFRDWLRRQFSFLKPTNHPQEH